MSVGSTGHENQLASVDVDIARQERHLVGIGGLLGDAHEFVDPLGELAQPLLVDDPVGADIFDESDCDPAMFSGRAGRPQDGSQRHGHEAVEATGVGGQGRQGRVALHFR